jgi:hypothetical protein
MDRIRYARDAAVAKQVDLARAEVKAKYGVSSYERASPEIEREAGEAEALARGKDWAAEKNAAEKEARDAIDQEIDDARALESASKAGHLNKIPSAKLDALVAHAKESGEKLSKLSDALNAVQQEAALAVNSLEKLNTAVSEAVGDDDDEDDLGDYADSADDMDSARAVLSSVAHKLQAIGNNEEPSEKEDDSDSYSDVDSETEIPEVPDPPDPDDAPIDPDSEDSSFEDEYKKDPGSFEDYCDANDIDLDDEDVDADAAKSEYEYAVDNFKQYVQAKSEYAQRDAAFAAAKVTFDAALDKLRAVRDQQAVVTQTALEKVYAKQKEAAGITKEVLDAHSALHDQAQEEVPDSDDLVNDSAFHGDTDEKGFFVDPATSSAYDDAVQAAGVLNSKKVDRREAMLISDSDGDNGSVLKDAAASTAKKIKQLAKVTGRPADLGKPSKPKKTKSKPKSEPEPDDSAEESISNFVSSLRILIN